MQRKKQTSLSSQIIGIDSRSQMEVAPGLLAIVVEYMCFLLLRNGLRLLS